MTLHRVIKIVSGLAACLCAISVSATANGQFTHIINMPPAADPGSIGSNTQLNLFDGAAILPGFTAGAPDGSSINVEVNVTGGFVGHGFTAYAGSTINVTGGTILPIIEVASGSSFNLNGGILDGDFDALSVSTVIIGGNPGGIAGQYFRAWEGSTVNISGGTLGKPFQALSHSNVNLYGTSFILGGQDITSSLLLDEPFVVTDRAMQLTGILTDGSPFEFDLNPVFVPHEEYFDSDATLTITLVPEPTTFCLLSIGGLNVIGRRRSS